MGILLSFAPFIVFAVLNGWLGAPLGLAAAAVVSAVLILRQWLKGRPPKLLEAGSFILFASLAIYAVAGGPTGSLFVMRLCVDAGLFLIVLVSIALRRPFTLQYAREQVPQQYWNQPAFLRANYAITAAWAAAFAVMVAADLVLAFMPSLPSGIGIAATVIALGGAILFTARRSRRPEPAATSAR
jgi:hypothetical protein